MCIHVSSHVFSVCVRIQEFWEYRGTGGTSNSVWLLVLTEGDFVNCVRKNEIQSPVPEIPLLEGSTFTFTSPQTLTATPHPSGSSTENEWYPIYTVSVLYWHHSTGSDIKVSTLLLLFILNIRYAISTQKELPAQAVVVRSYVANYCFCYCFVGFLECRY
jgi:hypothetical protein